MGHYEIMELTKSGVALNDVILDLFRLNSRLLMTGDRLVSGLGLTSARWQVLGAIAQAERPQSVAWIARDLGGHRQNVQRIVNDLLKEGLISLEPNPHHRRSLLVVLTKIGRKTFNQAMLLWNPWANSLADELSPEDIKSMGVLLKTLRQRLEDEQDTGNNR